MKKKFVSLLILLFSVTLFAREFEGALGIKFGTERKQVEQKLNVRFDNDDLFSDDISGLLRKNLFYLGYTSGYGTQDKRFVFSSTNSSSSHPSYAGLSTYRFGFLYYDDKVYGVKLELKPSVYGDEEQIPATIEEIINGYNLKGKTENTSRKYTFVGQDSASNEVIIEWSEESATIVITQPRSLIEQYMAENAVKDKLEKEKAKQAAKAAAKNALDDM